MALITLALLLLLLLQSVQPQREVYTLLNKRCDETLSSVTRAICSKVQLAFAVHLPGHTTGAHFVLYEGDDAEARFLLCCFGNSLTRGVTETLQRIVHRFCNQASTRRASPPLILQTSTPGATLEEALRALDAEANKVGRTGISYEGCYSQMMKTLTPQVIAEKAARLAYPVHKRVEIGLKLENGTMGRYQVNIRRSDRASELAATVVAQYGLFWSVNKNLQQLEQVFQTRLDTMSGEAHPPLPPRIVHGVQGSTAADQLKEDELRAKADRGELRERAAAANSLGEHLYTVAKSSEVLRLHQIDSTKYHPTLMAAAESAFRRAVALDPLHTMHHNNLGCSLAERKLHRSALMHFQAAVMLSPQFASAFSNLAETWFNVARAQKPLSSAREELLLTTRYYNISMQQRFASPQLFINYGEALESLGLTELSLTTEPWS